jgi:alkaline phosphatase
MQKYYVVNLLLLAAYCHCLSFEDESHMHPSPSKENLRSKRNDNSYESTSYFWRIEAQKKLRQQLEKNLNENVAKNVIFFIGDGMSVATISAGRIYSGQQMGFSGEEASLSFEEFPFVGLSKVRR